MLQVSFFTKLNNNVHIVCCLIDIIKTNNIFMRNFLHDFNLSFQILKVVCIHKDAFFDDFNSNFLVVGDINAQVDSSKWTLTKELVQIYLVLAYVFVTLHSLTN